MSEPHPITPADKPGAADHVWTIAEVVGLLEVTEKIATLKGGTGALTEVDG